MRSVIRLFFVACVLCWLPSNAGVLNTIYDQLTTGYHGNRVATSLDFRLPMLLQLGVQRRRLDISGTNVKRKTFWKGNVAGPLPTNLMHEGGEGVQMNGGRQSQKAMRYG